jgi:hypothetical protein
MMMAHGERKGELGTTWHCALCCPESFSSEYKALYIQKCYALANIIIVCLCLGKVSYIVFKSTDNGMSTL